MTDEPEKIPEAVAPPPPSLLELPRGELLTVSSDAYNADKAFVRKTYLDYINRSPAHLAAHLRGELDETTEAKLFGNLLHTWVLEADLIDSRYYREPEGNRSTLKWKAAHQEAVELNPGKIGFRPEDWDLGKKLRDAVYAHKGARTVLGCDGAFEQSVLWKNAETGEDCKARYDKTSVSKAFHADLKSTLDASPTGFGKAIVNYRYTVQADHYTEPTGLRFVLIAVEKKAPHLVAVYAISDEQLAHGNRHRMPNLRRFAECRASGIWPGYSESIQRIELPAVGAMSGLYEYVQAHAARGACRCGSCVDAPTDPTQPTGAHTVSVEFFDVARVGGEREEFERLVSEEAPILLDGNEHSYLEVGGLLGDQGIALMAMALGSLLGTWRLLTPTSMLGADEASAPLRMSLAGRGFITIQKNQLEALR